MPIEKDHLGEQLKERQRAEEDRYFQEQSKKQLEKLRVMHEQAAAAGKALCPRCGAALDLQQLKGVAVDACPKGHGIWLDQGELEEIGKREGDSWLARLIFGSKG
jgi:hypothetical protein